MPETCCVDPYHSCGHAKYHTPYSFHSWSLDIMGPITPTSRGKKWILVATEGFTKRVEAMAMKEATIENVVLFIKEYIICRFGLPRRIVTDSRTHFVNKRIGDVLVQYRIDHNRSTPYYPQFNG